MRKFFVIAITILFCIAAWSQSLDGVPCRAVPSARDHDGNVYHSVQIGAQCWMKESLHTLHYGDGTGIYPVYFPDNNKNNIAIYGALYSWHSASKEVCPKGWHVPSDAEWTQLANYLSSTSYFCGGKAGNIAKSLASTTEWVAKTNTCTVCNQPSSNNATGFSAMPAGTWDHGFGDFVRFWSSTSCYGKEAYYRMLSCAETGVLRSIESQDDFMSIRCIFNDDGRGEPVSQIVEPKPETAPTAEASPETQHADATPSRRSREENQQLSDQCISVEDYDGNVYPLVMLGSQCWMAENLRVTHYSNGEAIPLSQETTAEMVDHAFRCYPGANPQLVNMFGYLYTWTAAMHGSPSSAASPSGVQGICPVGWHLPSEAEWKQLMDYVGSESQYQCAGSKGKVNTAKALASTSVWSESNNPCAVGNDMASNNATGFNAMPAGTFYLAASFYFGEGCFFTTATEVGRTRNWMYYLWYKHADVKRARDLKGGYLSKYFPLSVRCVRDH